MKKTMYLALPMIALLAGAGAADAQMMGGGRDMMREPVQEQSASPQYRHGGEHMMYPGMMAGYGMGPGMMGGYGMGPGMMGGYAMGPGMMGCGMGYGMMGGHGPGHMYGGKFGGDGWGPGMHGLRSSGDFDSFLEETKDLRKKMHDLRFEYGEMMRKPETTIGDLKNMQQKMYELQQQIIEKAKK